MSFSSFLICTLFGSSLLNLARARPPTGTEYFPRHFHPWSADDNGIHEESKWGRFLSSGKPYTMDEIQSNLPDFNRYKGIGGFFPPGFADMNKVLWWEKRFPNDVSIPENIPVYDDGYPNDIDIIDSGYVKKRDYTAAQLVNMLKSLARARRHRQNRIVGKGLRFGISK